MFFVLFCVLSPPLFFILIARRTLCALPKKKKKEAARKKKTHTHYEMYMIHMKVNSQWRPWRRCFSLSLGFSLKGTACTCTHLRLLFPLSADLRNVDLHKLRGGVAYVLRSCQLEVLGYFFFPKCTGCMATLRTQVQPAWPLALALVALPLTLCISSRRHLDALAHFFRAPFFLSLSLSCLGGVNSVTHKGRPASTGFDGGAALPIHHFAP